MTRPANLVFRFFSDFFQIFFRFFSDFFQIFGNPPKATFSDFFQIFFRFFCCGRNTQLVSERWREIIVRNENLTTSSTTLCLTCVNHKQKMILDSLNSKLLSFAFRFGARLLTVSFRHGLKLHWDVLGEVCCQMECAHHWVSEPFVFSGDTRNLLPCHLSFPSPQLPLRDLQTG